MRNKKIASSGTVEGLVKLLNQFYYTTTIKIEGCYVYNSKGLIPSVVVTENKGRFTASFSN